MPDTKLVEICIKVVRAALASSVAKREDISFARADLSATKEIVGQPHLALVRHGMFGYAMGDSLLPLAQMNDQASATEDQDEGITWLDQQLDDTKADLHDRLLNLSPAFDLNVSVGIGDNPTLNIVYEDILRQAQFAGAVESDSKESKAARKLLFPEDENGVRQKSAVYQIYEDYADSVSNIQTQLNQARIAGDLETVRTLDTKLLRTRAEWKALGQKAKVEKALTVLEAADRDAGFEDERNRFIEILEARKVGRLSSALDYASVRLVPLEALINPEANNHWTEVVLSGADLEIVLGPKERSLFSVSLEEQATGASLVREASLEYTVVMLDREWLQEDFLAARYWRHSDRTLSDGKGGGEAPTVATKAIFVRSVECHIDDSLDASDKRSPAQVARKMMMYQAVISPITASLMLTSKTKATGNASDAARLKKPIASKLTKKQTANITKVLKMHTIGSKTMRPIKRVRRARAVTARATTAKSATARALNVKPAIAKLNAKSLAGIAMHVPRPKAHLTVSAKPTLAPVMIVKMVNSLIIRGRIEIGSNVELTDLVVSYKRIGTNSRPVGKEAALALTRDGSKQLRFGVTVSQRYLRHRMPIVHNKMSTKVRKKSTKVRKLRPMALSGVRIFLRDSSGAILIERVLKFGAKTMAKEIFWSATRSTSVLQLTPVLEPTLYAYAVEILPKSPNPDDLLDWKGLI